MTSPSIEYMRRIRREERVKLLGLRRERAVKALRSLELHGGSHAMLSQIAYAIHPQVGSWDEGACRHLRNVLAELIGDAREAVSGAQHVCACGSGGCHSRNKSKEVGYPFTQYDVLGNERQETVRRLRGMPSNYYDFDSPYHEWYEDLSFSMGVKSDGSFSEVRDRLIHLLGGDQSHDTSPMRQENETENPCTEHYVLDTSKAKTIGCEPDVSEGDDGTSVTSELREWAKRFKYTWINVVDGTIVYTTADFAPDINSMKVSDYIIAIADKIDAQFARVCEQQERVLQDTIDEMSEERDKARREVIELRKNRYELQRKYDELQGTIADLNEQLERRKAKCLRYKTHIDQMQGGSKRLRKELRGQKGMYLNLLRDAARDYKALQDKLNHVVEVCQSYTEAKCA